MKSETVFMLTARALLVGLSLLGCATPRKTAVVDMQRVVTEVAEGKAAKAELRRSFDQKQAALNRLEVERDELQARLKAEPSEDRRRELATEVAAKNAEAKQAYASFQKELNHGDRAAVKRIYDRVQPILREIQAEGGYDSVVQTGPKGPAAPADATPVTDDVIRRYDARFPK